MRAIYFVIFICCFLACKQQEQVSYGSEENAITIENQHPGTGDWLISVEYDTCSYPDHQFCRRPQIEGYCSETSYLAGDTLRVFVSTEQASDYTIDIYRMGYYQGNGGRLMKSTGPLKGSPQPVPEADSTNLIECKWDTAYQMAIPEDWQSGVYLGKLTTLRDTSQAYVVFIVKDDRPADIVFQCSDLTWQAYNRWPYWHSMYDEGQKPWVNTNGARISFDRPYGLYVNGLPSDFNGLTNGSGEFLLWEFPLAFWLEKEGYDVTYISNIDTHESHEHITRSKVFLSVSHDEYWTLQMFDNVSKARDSGVDLLFLCGNSVDGAVYLDPASDGRSNRITGRLPQRDFDNEQELMGASSYGVGYADFVSRNADHWFFENTGIQEGDTIRDLIGWEYHGYPLKEDTANLTVLGTAKIKPNIYKDPEAPDHACTIYESKSGSFVFNAGTCWWSMGLSSPPGFKNPVCNEADSGYRVIDFREDNPVVQQMTKNLLAKALGENR